MKTRVDSTACAPRSGQKLSDHSDQLRRLKGQFLASLNHEIRTPLSGILGMTDLLLETRLDDEQKEYVSAARMCAENLLALLNATLEFSDLSSGKLELEEMDFDLPGTLKAAVSSFLPKAEAKKLKLISALDPALPSVAAGDALRLRQLLSYLLDNAVKFTHKGQVEVSATAGVPCEGIFSLTVKVRDTGIGIPPEKLGAIFESFEQLDSGLSRSYSGLGLGLALAQKLVALMGGEISAESEPGRGSLLSFTIPLRVPSEHGDALALSFASLASSRVPSLRPRILVVEDNRIAQRVVRHILSRGPYEVECVTSGQEALRAASEQPYDLILMDLQIPDMDGLETTVEVRRLPGYATVPILALTANTTDDHRRLCRQHGMQGFIPKPVRSQELLDAVSRFLNSLRSGGPRPGASVALPCINELEF